MLTANRPNLFFFLRKRLQTSQQNLQKNGPEEFVSSQASRLFREAALRRGHRRGRQCCPQFSFPRFFHKKAFVVLVLGAHDEVVGVIIGVGVGVIVVFELVWAKNVEKSWKLIPNFVDQVRRLLGCSVTSKKPHKCQ